MTNAVALHLKQIASVRNTDEFDNMTTEQRHAFRAWAVDYWRSDFAQRLTKDPVLTETIRNLTRKAYEAMAAGNDPRAMFHVIGKNIVASLAVDYDEEARDWVMDAELDRLVEPTETPAERRQAELDDWHSEWLHDSRRDDALEA